MAEAKTRASQELEPGRRGSGGAPTGTHSMRLVLGITRPSRETTVAKRATTKKAAKKPAAKRELISPRGDKRYIRRDAAGRVKESDDVSRSLSQDRRRKAMKAAKSGQGDRGDRKPASKASARKKTRAKR